MYSGIALLAFPCHDWLQLHAGIACLASLAFDWLTAFWDSLSRLLHAGIACLVSPVCDWVIACWDSLSVTHAILYPNPRLVDYDFDALTLLMWISTLA